MTIIRHCPDCYSTNIVISAEITVGLTQDEHGNWIPGEADTSQAYFMNDTDCNCNDCGWNGLVGYLERETVDER